MENNMYTDFVGRELKHNDLVVSKPGGRHARMKKGIIRDELSNVWFGQGCTGGSDIIRIETQDDPSLEDDRLALVEEREKELVDREIDKKEKAASRIKKKDFKRFGVYSSQKSNWDMELYLGTCFVGEAEFENVWIKVNRIDYAGDNYTKDNLRFSLWDGGYFGTTPSKHRIVQYPQKFNEVALYTEDEIKSIFEKDLLDLKAHVRYRRETENQIFNIKY